MSTSIFEGYSGWLMTTDPLAVNLYKDGPVRSDQPADVRYEKGADGWTRDGELVDDVVAAQLDLTVMPQFNTLMPPDPAAVDQSQATPVTGDDAHAPAPEELPASELPQETAPTTDVLAPAPTELEPAAEPAEAQAVDSQPLDGGDAPQG